MFDRIVLREHIRAMDSDGVVVEKPCLLLVGRMFDLGQIQALRVGRAASAVDSMERKLIKSTPEYSRTVVAGQRMYGTVKREGSVFNFFRKFQKK